MNDSLAATAPAPTDPAASTAQALLCPRCGYDLRGTTSDRCSECGQPIDRAILAESGLPWAQRKKLGRFRAFRMTVRLIAFDSKRIRDELSKPQDLRDARRFRTCVTVLLAISVLIAFGTFAWADKFEKFLLSRSALTDYNGQPLAGWQQDLLVPWNSGLSLFWIVPILLVLATIYQTGVISAAMRNKPEDPRRRETADAVGQYAIAPLAWLALSGLLCLPILLLATMLDSARGTSTERSVLQLILIPLMLIAGALPFLIPLLMIRRAGQWIARTRHAGIGGFLLGVGEYILRSAVGWIVCFFVIPWCVGLIWMAFDSLR